MARLFISLYLDEDVDVLIADLLRARGFEVMTTQEAGNVAKSDPEQINCTVNQRKTFLTHNRIDFERIHREYLNAKKQHYGIIIAVRHAAHKLAQRVLAILNHVAADEMENQLRYI